MSIETLRWNGLSATEQRAALSRSQLVTDGNLTETVATIVEQVKTEGDAALNHFAEQFEGGAPASLTLIPSEQSVTLEPALQQAIDHAFENIKCFHQAQKVAPLQLETQPGIKCELRHEAIDSVGLYIPGGTAPLISTALMLAIPAMLAGCRQKVLTTPSPVHPAIIYLAQKCAVDLIVPIGGAQAVAAMAFGTESVPKVDKIFGPGNRFVTEAKSQVAQSSAAVTIDMPAGPSEVLVIADEQANPAFIAADLLSQAEHGVDSQVILVTPSQTIAVEVNAEIERQLATLPRADIAKGALQSSRIIICENLDEAVDISNQYGPEHLIIQTERSEELANLVRAAGSVFVGPWTPESVGDYASGTNHVLPTYGYSRSVSSLSLSDFQRRFTVQTLSQEGLLNLADTVQTLAAAEGLDAHKNAVAIRVAALKGA